MENNCINFFFEEIEEPVLDYTKIKLWLSSLINKHQYQLLEVNYILCSDEYLLKVNKEYLNHDYYTDIITFDNSDQDKEIEGDIFVSIDRVKNNSADLQTNILEETIRVLAHGILHLCGYKDKTPEDASTMRSEENKAIELYNNS